MSNKIINFPTNRTGNHGKQAAINPVVNPVTEQPLPLDPNTLNSFHCPGCKSAAFTSAMQLLEVPATFAGNPTGKPQVLKVDVLMCLGCGGVWSVPQLLKLTSKEREILRIEMEMQQLGKEEGVN
ncbi:MAG: hypothetical protein WC390_08690 [Sulfurimonas sp.]|jgi:hypothetical protein